MKIDKKKLSIQIIALIGLSLSVKLAFIYYFANYDKIKVFMDDAIKNATDNGYALTIFNRRRYIPEINSNNFMVRQFGARVAMNTPIQGTAADIIKIAMVDLYNKLKENNLESKILLQIHDELLLNVKN